MLDFAYNQRFSEGPTWSDLFSLCSLKKWEAAINCPKTCSVHCKYCEISRPYNLWTSVKSNILDVWNWNLWPFFELEIEGGGGGWGQAPPGAPSGYVPNYVGSHTFNLYRIFSEKEISYYLIPTGVSYLFFWPKVTKSHISKVWNCHFRFWISKKYYPVVSINLFKTNNGNPMTMCEIYSKLTIKAPEQV